MQNLAEKDRDQAETSVLLRYYHVFNIEQCDGLRASYGDDWKSINPIEQCESITSSMPNPPRIERNSRAYYSPSADTVGIPSRSCFESAESYYITLFHELIHSTGHASRLNRFDESSSDHQFGSESYSAEELVAEVGAAMLAGIVGISPATLANSASYLQSWINRLRSDSRLIISAASQAQKAVDYILGERKKVCEYGSAFSNSLGGKVSPSQDRRFRRVGEAQAHTWEICGKSVSIRVAFCRSAGHGENHTSPRLGRYASRRNAPHPVTAMRCRKRRGNNSTVLVRSSFVWIPSGIGRRSRQNVRSRAVAVSVKVGRHGISAPDDFRLHLQHG